MKYTLKRDISPTISYHSNCLMQEIKLEGEELLEFLYEVLVDSMYGTLDPDLAGRTPEIYLKNLQNGRLGDFSKRYILSAKEDEKTIGILIGLPDSIDEKSFHIFSLGVSPKYRGQGIGRALVGRLIECLAGSTYKNIILDVHADNVPALRLYKKLGFRNNT